MGWLNYHHLYYFWTVARAGSVSAAARELRVSQPTISGQVKQLEAALGERLLRRAGRKLELTEMGKLAFRYADGIFRMGRELQDALAGRAHLARLTVGVSDLVPKLILSRLLAPVLAMEPSVRLICREDKIDRLLAELAVHDVDLVIAEAPSAGQASARAFNHLLGQSAITFFAAPKLWGPLRRGFPRSLDGAPMLVPTGDTLLRRQLDYWLAASEIRPRIVAEFDSALLKDVGADGAGVFPGPTAVQEEICARYGVRPLGRVDALVEHYYAITVERRITHPVVRLISANAKQNLFRA